MPELCEDLLSSVDQPLKIARDKTVGKDYLLCDYNRDGDSYRLLVIACSWGLNNIQIPNSQWGVITVQNVHVFATRSGKYKHILHF